MSSILRNKKEYHSLTDELKVYASQLKEISKRSENIVKVVKEARNTCLNVRGIKTDEKKGEKLQRVSLVFFTFPVDPTQITTMTGATLYATGALIKKIENKSAGIKDVAREYRRAIHELRLILNDY